MKDENKNIDAFFLSRLQNETVGDDDWNMPSDDIWNAAKPSFVERKKRKRRFIFWLLIPLLGICLSIPFLFITADEAKEIIVDSTQQLHDPTKANSEIIQTTTKEMEQLSSGIVKVEESAKDVTIGKSKNGRKDSKGNEKENQKKNMERKKSNIFKAQTVNPKILISKENALESDNKKTGNSEDENKVIARAKGSNINELKNRNRALLSMAAIDSNIDYSKTLNPLIVGEMQIQSPKVDRMDNKFIIPLAQPRYRNEIGISHTEMLINLALVLDGPPDNEGDVVNLSSNYFNANITGRKWINKNWSFMTGAQYFSLDLDIDFSIIDTLDRELMKFINEELDEITSRSSISDQESDFTIDLIEGVDAQLGDVLNIHGDARQQVRAIQIPFFLDYHIYKRKWEYILGLGVSVEYISVTQIVHDLKIFKENELITKPANFPDLNDKFIDGSIYLKSGIRYALSDRINMGLDAKFNLLGWPFSGIDAGIYYRWN